MVYCLKYSNYFSVRNLPRTSRQSSFFTISWSDSLRDYSWAFCSCIAALLYVCAASPLCLEPVEQAVRSCTPWAPSNKPWGREQDFSWLPQTLDRASCCKRFVPWHPRLGSFLCGRQRCQRVRVATFTLRLQKSRQFRGKKKKILFKGIPETLFSHLAMKENVPVYVSVSMHFSPLLKFARYSISVPSFFLQIFRLMSELFCEKWC